MYIHDLRYYCNISNLLNGSNLPCHGRSPPQHRDLRRTAELLRKGGAAAAPRRAAAAAESAADGGAAQRGGLQRGAAVDGEGHQTSG